MRRRTEQCRGHCGNEVALSGRGAFSIWNGSRGAGNGVGVFGLHASTRIAQLLQLILIVLASLCGSFVLADQVRVWPAPAGALLSTDYQVSVNGQPVPTYLARVLDPPFAGKEYDYGGNYAFVNFDSSVPVRVRIHSQRSLRNTVVRPRINGVKLEVLDDHSLELTLPGPCKLSLEPDGKKGPLLLFGNPPEGPPPKAEDPGVVYFGPGIHQVGGLSLTNDQTLYLAAGAVVKGGVSVSGQNIRILGRGILDSSDYEWRKGPTPHVIWIRGTNVEVSGITILGASHWTIVPQGSRKVVIRNVKICGGRVQNDDGINPCNSQDVLVTDCFIRSDDDCIALKGIQLAPGNNVERIRIEDSTLWCDRARIFLLGHESRAEYMRDISLKNLDIIHFTMTPFLFEPGEEMRLEKVQVEQIRIHGEGQRELIRIQPVVNQYMHRKVPGHVNDIQFKDVRVEGTPGLYRVQLKGGDEQHRVQKVAFTNLTVNGKALAPGSPMLEMGPHVDDIRL